MKTIHRILLACICAGLFQAATVSAATSSNTLVRFQLRYGATLFGNVDVELFDHDKPATVANFLSYVRSGAFNHTFFDNVVPGYLVKGGEYRIETPYSDALMDAIQTIPENAAITNEFNTGRVYPNVFGTLAMALNYTDVVTNIVTTNGTETVTNSVTVPDSATTAWFFNTGDNSTDPDADFDNQKFVVFGRVVKGGEFLSYFNTLEEFYGLLDMNEEPFLSSDCNFPADGTNEFAFTLPVAFLDFRCPQYNDVFNVSISVLSASNVVDNVAPTLKLSYPIKSTVITNNNVIARGTATDAGSGVGSVIVYLNTNTPVAATVTVSNTWSANLTSIPAGTNLIRVEATDARGNRTVQESTFFHLVYAPLNLSGSSGTGTGRTVGPTNQQMLVIDRIYTITAIPDPTNLFVAWESLTLPSRSTPTVSFRMVSNLTIFPKFDTNFFPFVAGTYNGLFHSPDQIDPAGSGFFTMKLENSGAYSAKIQLNGSTVRFSGGFSTIMSNGFPFFSPAGMRGFTILRMGFDILTLNDQIVGSLTNFYARIVGTNNNVLVIATNTWYANLTADRARKTNSSPYAGKYTLSIPADDDAASGPAGDGYGTVTVSPAGAVTLAGALADGTRISQKVPLSKDGHWPLYINPLKTNAALISWINFTNEPMSDLRGPFAWFKYRHKAKTYPDGFTNEAEIVGSRFTRPSGTTNQMLFLTNGFVGFTNGNLAADFANEVGISISGKVTNLEPNRLSVTLNSGNGLMTGSVTPPGTNRAIPFKGVVLQKQTNAAGFFLNGTNSGRVSLGR